VFVAGASAIQHQRKAKMLVGLSYISVVGYPVQVRTKVIVEEKFGPFVKA
jgi:hypothetical protein